MQTPSLFPVGNQLVDRRQVDAALIAQMADSAKNINAPGNLPADSWTALAERVTRDDAVSEEDLKQLQDLGKICFSYHRKLHADFKASGYKDRQIASELAEVHVFDDGDDRIHDALRLSSAKSAVAALAGASFGPAAIVTAYTAYARLEQEKLEPLMHELQEIREGKSHTTFAGNKVEGFHRHEIWPQMIHLLDGAVEGASKGHPTEVDAQYYELTNQQIVGKLADAARAGNKVRVNVDAGRLVGFKGKRVEIDEVPDKLRSILQLTGAQGDIAVSAYPVPVKLEDPKELMHRKGLRVGDQFLLSGMNANEGSGENIDAGYLIEGPAARQLVANFARDVAASAGATNEDVYGAQPLADFMSGDVNMGPRGLIALFDCQDGPSPAGTSLPRAENHQELAAVAGRYGQKVSDYVDASPEKIDELLAQGEQLPLSAQGKQKFLDLVERALGSTRTQTNIDRLDDIALPEGKPEGTTTVAIADLPAEREAIMMTAIQEAEQFIYVPAFVMTRTIAAMLVARRDELKEQGKDLDLRVIADAGIYPDGGTPNQEGVKFLENAGVPVRWAMVTRSGDHDRKIHAKELLTDKGEFFGSTNFSNKGLRENWEHSGYVRFDESDPQSMLQRDRAKEHFLALWDRESFELNSLEKGKILTWRHRDEKDYLVQADEARFGVQRDTIRGIEDTEKAIAAFVADQAVGVSERIEALEKQGYDEGSAILMAVEEKMGADGFYGAIAQLPERQALEQLKPRPRR